MNQGQQDTKDGLNPFRGFYKSQALSDIADHKNDAAENEQRPKKTSL